MEVEGEGVSRVTDSYNFAPRRFNEFHHDYRFIEIYKYNAGETWDIIDPCRYIFNNRVIGHLPPSRGLPLPTVRAISMEGRRDARGQRINAVRFLTRPLTVSEIQFCVSFFPFFFFLLRFFFVRYIFFFLLTRTFRCGITSYNETDRVESIAWKVIRLETLIIN